MCETRRDLWSNLDDMILAHKKGAYNISEERMLKNIQEERDSCNRIYKARGEQMQKWLIIASKVSAVLLVIFIVYSLTT